MNTAGVRNEYSGAKTQHSGVKNEYSGAEAGATGEMSAHGLNRRLDRVFHRMVDATGTLF